MTLLDTDKPVILIKQTGSPIRRNFKQEFHLKSLGLGKINKSRYIIDSPSSRGLLKKLSHMVVVIE